METREGLFAPQHYWEQRLLMHPYITGVGYLGRAPKFVEYQYRMRMYQVESILRYYGLTDLEGRSVLDIGSGTCIWLNFWHQHGASCVVGLDFAQPSIDRLKTQFPNDLIVQADVSVAPLTLTETMGLDVISAFDVLLHIVDPNGFRLNNPLEAPNRLAFTALAAYWKTTELWGNSSILTRLIGPIVTKIDQLACGLCSDGNSPGSKSLLLINVNDMGIGQALWSY